MSLDWVLILVCLLVMLVGFPLALFYDRRAQWYGQQAADLHALHNRLERDELSLDEAERQYDEIRARRFLWRLR